MADKQIVALSEGKQDFIFSGAGGKSKASGATATARSSAGTSGRGGGQRGRRRGPRPSFRQRAADFAARVRRGRGR